MDVIFLAAAAILLSLPPLVFGVLGFRKWRQHYGPGHTLLGYHFRYATRKRATDDPWPIALAKIVIFLIWILLVTSFIFH